MSASTNPNENNMTAMTSPANNPMATQGQVPDLMKIGTIPVNTVQEVETSILDPVVKSDRFARFVFQNKGLLHSHSKIEIGLTNSGEDAVPPLGIGAYAFIQRVALKIGNQTICEIDDFNHYYAYRSLFVSNENQKEREQMTTGRMISHAFAYADRTSVNGGGESLYKANGYTLDNGKEANVRKLVPSTPRGKGDLVDGTAEYYPNTWQLTKQPDAQDTNRWQLSLSELCPFLRHNQLPLYLIKEQVSLELTFSGTGDVVKATDRVAVKFGESPTAPFPIDTDNLRMISDHIFYPQELMLQYAQANKVLNFTYADYRLSKMSVAQADAGTQQIRNLGGAGRIVNKIIWGMQDEDATSAKLVSGYVSVACAKDYTDGDPTKRKNGVATFNIKYNDTFEFPIDVSNPARQFHNVNQAEGMVPFITREEYSNEGNSITDRKWYGNTESTHLQGRFNHHSQRLTKQERINSRGIELYFKYDALPTNTNDYTQRAWLEVMRTATLANGYAECYFA